MDVAGYINRALRRVPAWPLYLLGLAWAAWLFWLGLTGGLGPEPIKALEHRYGKTAIQLLAAVLLVTPLRRYGGINLLRYRRALGLLVFFFVLAHFAVWAILDVQSFDRVWADIIKRPYVTIGMAGLALLLPVAITSNSLSLRRLGAAAWRRLHLLTYPAAILGALHYVWLVKGFQIEPLIYLAVMIGLVSLRLRWNRRRQTA